MTGTQAIDPKTSVLKTRQIVDTENRHRYQTEKMTRRNICCISVMLFSLLAWSTANAKLYKWTDENGEVHYSQTPPPKQGDIKPFKEDRFPSDEEITYTLGGEWKSTYQGKVILLEFIGDGRFNQWRDSRVAFNHLYSGQWSVRNRHLVLYYTRADNEAGKIGEKNTYKFSKVSADYFSVTDKNGGDMIFSRTEKWQPKR